MYVCVPMYSYLCLCYSWANVPLCLPLTDKPITIIQRVGASSPGRLGHVPCNFGSAITKKLHGQSA